MRPHKLITVSAAGMIAHYNPPETTPHKTQQTDPPSATTNTLPLLTSHKSLINHSDTKTRFAAGPITALTTKLPLLATGDREGTIQIYQLPSREVTRVGGHVNEVTEVRFSDDGELLLSSGVDGFVNIYRLSNPAKPALSLPHSLPVTTFITGYAGSSARVITASTDRSIRVFHLSSGSLLSTVRLPVMVTCLTGDETENFWYGCVDGGIGHVRIGELPVGGIVQGRVFAKGEGRVTCMVKADSGLVVGFDSGVIQMYDGSTLIREFGGGAAIVRVMVSYEQEQEDDVKELLSGDCGEWAEEGVVLVGGCGEAETGWDVVKNVGEDLFKEAVEDVVPVEGETEKLRAEVERLRKRNRELEDAGSRLIDVCERYVR